MKTPLLTTNRTSLSIIVFLILLLWSTSHVPFLSADADYTTFTNSSRAPWTDEGLYTGQVRNYINHNHFNLLEGDALLKSPLLSAYLYIPFTIAGTSLIVARTSILILVIFTLLFFLQNTALKFTLIGSILSFFTFLPVHQHCHFSLAEICSICMLLLAALSFIFYITSKNKLILTLCYVLLLGATLFKLQFIYTLFIPTLAILIHGKDDSIKSYIESILLSLVHLSIIGLVIFFAWYFPFSNEFEWVAKQQGTFNWDQVSYDFFDRNIKLLFLHSPYATFTYSFITALIIGLFELYQKKMPPVLKSLFIFSMAWLIIEMHKLPMAYLPLRYVISIYCVMGLTIAVVFSHVISIQKRFLLKITVALLIINLCYANTTAYYKAYQNRTYVIANTNKFIKAHTKPQDVIIGAWAPALTWESKNISFPIWKDFLQTNKPIETFKPSVVISEWNEEDSGEAYKNLGITLAKCSDLDQNITIAFWKINMYWLNPQKKCH